MKYHFPDYYHSFRCIGGQCPDTCCRGWNIAIDSKSLKEYKALEKSLSQKQLDFARKLEKSIDFRRGTFRIEDRSCPFLNADNLCDLYIHAGQDSLCDTCRLYPRHQEEFGDLREISLSLSCPEAARIILTQPNRPQLLTKYTSRPCPQDQKVDQPLLQWLLRAREIILDIIWSSAPLTTSVSMALAFSHDLQLRHSDRRFFESGHFNSEKAAKALEQLAAKYLSPDAPAHFQKQLVKHVTNAHHELSCAVWTTSLLKTYSTLELILEDWPELLHSCRHFIKKHPHTPLPHLSQNALWEKHLLTYYIQVYFPGAIYDDDLYGKLQFAATSWLMTLLLAESLPTSARPGNSLPDSASASPNAPWLQAAYLYSRQVENSDPNLNTLFETYQQTPQFHLITLLTYLNAHGVRFLQDIGETK